MRRINIKPARQGLALSRRQVQVLRLIAEGDSNKQIAAKLCLSIKTIETHRMQLMRRIGIRGTAGLVRYAIQIGLTTAAR